METGTLVRNELAPLLDRLIVQLEDEGQLTYRAHFTRIRTAFNPTPFFILYGPAAVAWNTLGS